MIPAVKRAWDRFEGIDDPSEREDLACADLLTRVAEEDGEPPLFPRYIGGPFHGELLGIPRDQDLRAAGYELHLWRVWVSSEDVVLIRVWSTASTLSAAAEGSADRIPEIQTAVGEFMNGYPSGHASGCLGKV